MKQKVYARAGVDIDLGNRVKAALPQLLAAIGDELLKVHVSYGPLVQALLNRFNSRVPPASSRQTKLSRRQDAGGGKLNAIKALAHITGGGLVDNIPRILPKNCHVVIRKGSWDMLPIFQLIQAKGGVPEEELYQVFNMGIGMAVIVAADKADGVLNFVRAQHQKAWLIGEVVKGNGATRLVG